MQSLPAQAAMQRGGLRCFLLFSFFFIAEADVLC
jgi:hypothetical protein